MIVYIPMPLRTYTRAPTVEAAGATLAELCWDLDRRYPGLRFRIIDEQDQVRQHVKIFVNQTLASSLNQPLQLDDQVRIVMAISGG